MDTHTYASARSAYCKDMSAAEFKLDLQQLECSPLNSSSTQPWVGLVGGPKRLRDTYKYIYV